MSLKKQTIFGVIWTLTQQGGTQVVNLIVQVILARLLLPEAFGLIAILQIFLSIGTALLDGGMTSSLIRTKNPDQADYSTVFFMNLGASIVLYLILFFTAPFIATFFALPELTLIVRVYTLTFIVQALVGVQTTRLTKEMNFKLQMFMQIPSVLFGGAVGILLAKYGFGIWSLVWMYLAASTLFMIEHWIWAKWKPALIIDFKKLKYHLDFGYKITLSTLVTSIYKNIYTIIIGKMFSVTQLGFFTQADTLSKFPIQNLNAALQKVTYPVFATVKDDNLKLKSILERITQMVFFVVTPVMLILTIAAEHLFGFVLGYKWLPAVPYFQILCISAISYPLSIYTLNIILAKGRSNLHLKLEVIKKVSSGLFLFLIIPFGIYGVVIAAAISIVIHSALNSYYCGRLINYPIQEQILGILPVILIGILSAVLITLLSKTIIVNWKLNDLFYIIVVTLSYLVVYILLSVFFKVKSISEFGYFKDLLIK